MLFTAQFRVNVQAQKIVMLAKIAQDASIVRKMGAHVELADNF